MNLIKPHFKILEPTYSIYTDIERAARLCYKSEDKIAEGTAEILCDKLIENKHLAMLEHGTIYLKIPDDYKNSDFVQFFYTNPYSISVYDDFDAFITTNYRVILENHLEVCYNFFNCEPTKHIRRVSVKFVVDRGISHELVRHRVFSFAQESTRYCNYSKKEHITFIIPSWLPNIPEITTNTLEKLRGLRNEECDWAIDMLESQNSYFDNIESYNWTPQQARSILPTSLKTEIIMTGNVNQWKEFFALRCAKNVHPQMLEVSIPLRQEFINRGWIKENSNE